MCALAHAVGVCCERAYMLRDDGCAQYHRRPLVRTLLIAVLPPARNSKAFPLSRWPLKSRVGESAVSLGPPGRVHTHVVFIATRSPTTLASCGFWAYMVSYPVGVAKCPNDLHMAKTEKSEKPAPSGRGPRDRNRRIDLCATPHVSSWREGFSLVWKVITQRGARTATASRRGPAAKAPPALSKS